MSKYTEAVERNTEGLDALSTGVCPGCEECRSQYDEYQATEDDEREENEPHWYVPADPTRGTERAYFYSEGNADIQARYLFDTAVSNGEVYDEPSFSGSGCDICGSNLAGDLSVYHWIDRETREIQHGFGACMDCVIYLANGDEPESWGDS